MKKIFLFITILLVSCTKFEQPLKVTDATLTRGVRDLTLRFTVSYPVAANIKIIREGVVLRQTSINAKDKVTYWYSQEAPLSGYYYAEIIINGNTIKIQCL